MKYIVYLTVNKKSKINGLNRIYVGVHRTKDPFIFDGYLGNGVYAGEANTFKYPKTPFQFAVKKYGIENFERITLFICDTLKDAYDKKSKIVTTEFINLSHTYNVSGDSWNITGPLYQFSLNGKVIKKWNDPEDCFDFYGYPKSRFDTMRRTKHSFLRSYWAVTPKIDISKYSDSNVSSPIYIYNLDGKMIREYLNQEECAKDNDLDIKIVSDAIKYQKIVNGQFYISNKMIDQFMPKPRRNYIKQTFYVYKADGTFVGQYIGKKLMNVIKLHSWKKIANIFSLYNNWYEDFYITFEPVDTVPPKPEKKRIKVDVYDKYGNFIETLESLGEVKHKYNVPNYKLKDIQQGDKYFEDYIFKYSK